MKKAQSALEYLIVSGFVLLLLVPVLFLMYNYIQDYRRTIAVNQVNEIGQAVIANAEQIYFFGAPSQVVLEVNLPGQIQGMNTVTNLNGVNCEKCTELHFIFQGGQEKLVFPSTIMLVPEVDTCETVDFQLNPTTTIQLLNCTYGIPFYGEGVRKYRLKATDGNVTMGVVGI